MSDALNRGLDVLEILASRGETRVVDLMAELGVSRATAHRLLGSLEQRGYVEHLRDDHVWKLGPAVTELAAGFDSASIIQLAAPAMADLLATTRETINLAVLHRNRLIYAASFDGAHALRMATTIGETVPLHCTAAGKAILAALSNDEWSRFLPPEPLPERTPSTRTTYAELLADVEAARARGWALDDEESELSGICVGAPILGREGRPVAAISISSVAGRLPHDAQEATGRAVRTWCEAISKELRGRGTAAKALHTA